MSATPKTELDSPPSKEGSGVRPQGDWLSFTSGSGGECASATPDEVKRRARRLEEALSAAAAVIVGTEAAAYLFGALSIGEAFVTTPLVPFLLTFVLVVDQEIGWGERSSKRRRVRSDFKKSLLMLVGGMLVMAGVAASISAISADLDRVIFDIGSGSSLICAGIYTVKRFAW